MKKSMRLLMVLLLMLSLCACGGEAKPAETTVPPTTRPDYSQQLNEAEELWRQGNLNAAYAKFLEAGPEGQYRIEEIREEVKEEVFDAVRVHVSAAFDIMKSLPEGFLDEETTRQWTNEMFQVAMEKYTERINGEHNYASFSAYDGEHLQRLSDEVAASQLGNTPEGQALIDSCTFLQGIMKFQFAYNTIDWEDPGFEEAYQLFASCAEGSAGYEVAQAIDQIRAGSFREAADLMIKHINSKERVADFVNRYAPRSENQTLANKINYNRVVDILRDKKLYTGPLENMMDSEGSYRMGILSGSGMTKAQRTELKDLCANNPEGKVLILQRWKKYGDSSKQLDLEKELMQKLPQEYYPESLEQVEYVILLDCDYAKNGTFKNGTVRILETTTLTLYNAEGTKLYTKKVKGDTDDTMYYMGDAPKYYSPGSPDMLEALRKALTTIVEQ